MSMPEEDAAFLKVELERAQRKIATMEAANRESERFREERPMGTSSADRGGTAAPWSRGPLPSDVTLMTAIVGGGIGAGYVAVRLFRQSRALLTTGKAEAGGGEGKKGEKKKFPMLDMAEVARRAVPRKKSFLYTRSGDKGTSQLYNMERRPKSDPAFEALGNMDELNASLALAAEHSELAENGLYEMLVTIQSLIIDASALVATPRDSSSIRKISRTGFPTWCTDHLEACIDELDARTPPLKTFIIPGGGLAACHLHMARCVCRRAERSLQPLLGTGQGVEEVVRFVNRLSDLLFAASRYASLVDGKPEQPWKKLPAQKESVGGEGNKETPQANGSKQ